MIFPLVLERDAKTAGQKCHFPHSLAKNIIFKNSCLCEHQRIGKECDDRSCLIKRTGSNLFERKGRLASGKTLTINSPVLADFYLQPFRECIYNGSTYAVKTAGDFISASAKLTAGMKFRKNKIDRISSGLVVDSDRYTPAVIHDSDGIIRMDNNSDFCAESCQRFVNSIIHNFINQVMKTSGGSCTDIHAGSFSDCLQSFQYLNGIRIILADFCSILYIIIRILPFILLIVDCIGAVLFLSFRLFEHSPPQLFTHVFHRNHLIQFDFYCCLFFFFPFFGHRFPIQL